MNAKALSEDEFFKWQKKRTSTFIVFNLMYLLNGIHAAFMNTTIWVYVTQQIETDQPYLVFGLINAVVFLPSSLLNPFIAYFGDKYRRPKLMLIWTNNLSIIGSILYMLYFSPWYPIVGTTLLGFRFPLQSIMVAEIVRSYPQDEVIKKLSIFANMVYLGLCPTVVILMVFQNVDIYICGLHIRYGNINTTFIIALSAIAQLLAVFFVHDLSKEYDLKQIETMNTLGKDELRHKRLGCTDKIRRLFSSLDVILSYYLTFLFGYAEITMLKYIPIIILTKLSYSVNFLNIGLLITSLSCVIIIGIVIKMNITTKVAYAICITAFLAMIINGIIFLFMKPTNTYQTNWILAILVYMCFSIFYLADEVYLVCIVAKLVKSDIQGFAESFRLSCKHISSVLAGISIEVVARYYEGFFVILTVVIFLSIGCMVVRRHALQYPKAWV